MVTVIPARAQTYRTAEGAPGSRLLQNAKIPAVYETKPREERFIARVVPPVSSALDPNPLETLLALE